MSDSKPLITVDNSESTITGISIELYKNLREVLSYSETSQNYYSKTFRPSKKYLLDKKGLFPTGLLYLIEGYLKTNKILYSLNDIRRTPIALKSIFTLNLSQRPYPEQIDAARAFKEAGGRGIITAPTGTGKSLIAALVINEMQVPTIVIVPSLELKRQTIRTLQELFGSTYGSKGSDIWVTNVDSMSTKEQVDQKYQLVIIDEFHHSGAKTYRTLNKKALSQVYYRCGLTATPFRSQDNERLLLESVLSKVIYKIDYATAVKKAYIVPMEAYYYELPKRKVEGFTWAQVYSELVVNNDQRNQLISMVLKSLRADRISVLCLVKEIKHGETLSELSNVHFANGQNQDSEDLIRFFNDNKITTLIGTTGILGEGVDTKPAEFIIIAGLGKSKNSFMQACGRGFRRYPGKESCKIIILLDRSHKWSKEHFKTQCKILLEEYNIIPTKLDLLV